MTVVKSFFKTAIRIYQTALSPVLGPRCRFHPSCSDYASEAIERHGAAHGVWLSLKRLSRCHPLNDGGHDPVPHPTPNTASPNEARAKS